MKPVAWRTYQGGFVHTSRPELADDWGDGAEPLVSLSDAEARIAELEARLKEVAGPCSLGVGCEQYCVCYADSNGQPDQCGKPSYECDALRDARRIADHDKKLWLAAEARAEAAEALLKEAKTALEPLCVRAEKWSLNSNSARVSVRLGDLRAARSIAAKIGGRNGE